MKDEYEGKYHKNIFMIAGVLALVYGVGNYLRVTYELPPYSTWIGIGVILIVVGWFKKSWMHKE